MKRTITAILLLLCCNAVHAQKLTAKADTNQIKNKLNTFIRLHYKRTEVDSLVALCNFPLYSKAWYGNKTWRSAKQLKKEMNDILMRSKFRETNYTVQSLYQVKNRKNALIKNKNYTCFQMMVHLPEIGDGADGSLVKFIFYMEKIKPYKIIAIVYEDL